MFEETQVQEEQTTCTDADLTVHSLVRGFLSGLAVGLALGAMAAIGHKIGDAINGH